MYTSKHLTVIVKPKTSFHKRENHNSISHIDDHSLNISKDPVIVHRHLQTESTSATPTHLENQKSPTKYKSIDWQMISQSLSPSHSSSYLNLFTKKKETSSSNEFRKELSASFMVKAIDPATRSSPQVQDIDSTGKRPISVAFSGIKGKIEVRGKPSKILNESLGFKLIQNSRQKEDRGNPEANRRVSSSMIPVSKLRSSETYKVKRDGIFINLREKNATPLTRLEEKLVLHRSYSPEAHNKFLRTVANESADYSGLAGAKNKSKESIIYYQKMDDPMFRGIPLTLKTEPNIVIRKEETRLKARKGTIPPELKAKIFKKASLSLMDSPKLDILRTESNGSGDNMDNMPKPIKIEKAKIGIQGNLPTVVSINFGYEDTIKDDRLAKEILSKISGFQNPKKMLRESTSPQNRSENVSRVGQSRNREFEDESKKGKKANESTEEFKKRQRPNTQSLRDTNADRSSSFLKEFMGVVATTMIEEENQNQEDDRPVKDNRNPKRYYYTFKKNNEGSSFGKKNREKGTLDEIGSATIKDEQPTLLEKKLITQLGKDENLVGWGTGSNRSDMESVVRYNSGRWKTAMNEGHEAEKK